MNSLLTVKENFEADTRRFVGSLYYIRKGNLEVLDSVIPRLRDHLAVGLGILPIVDDSVNGVEVVSNCDPHHFIDGYCQICGVKVDEE